MSSVSKTPDDLELDKPYLRFEFALNKLKNRKYASSILGKSEDMLTAYAKGRTDPPFSVVIALSKATNIDINWFAAGENEASLSQNLNSNTLKIAIETVEEILEGINRKVYADEKSQIIQNVYYYIIEDPEYNPAKIIKLIFKLLDTNTV